MTTNSLRPLTSGPLYHFGQCNYHSKDCSCQIANNVELETPGIQNAAISITICSCGHPYSNHTLLYIEMVVITTIAFFDLYLNEYLII